MCKSLATKCLKTSIAKLKVEEDDGRNFEEKVVCRKGKGGGKVNEICGIHSNHPGHVNRAKIGV